MKKRVIIVDDEVDIREILEVNLKSEGYDVVSFSSGTSALEKKKKNPHADLIILDIMMEGIDGYEYCKIANADKVLKKIPIMFLSAKTDEFDKVLGLEFGGDDYLTKPFGIKELKSRVKALIRRTSVEKAPDDSPLVLYKGIELNKSGYSLKIDGKDVKLTKTEFEMFLLFITSFPSGVNRKSISFLKFVSTNFLTTFNELFNILLVSVKGSGKITIVDGNHLCGNMS
jgi:DNA-binding response OmpR family regulator